MANNLIVLLNTLLELLILCVIILADSHEDKKEIEYRTVYVEDTKVCRLDGEDGVVRLGFEQESALILTTNKYFGNWSGKYSLTCSFTVKAPPEHGLFAVIQSLNLRKDEKTGQCLDYVKLKGKQAFAWLLGKSGPEEYYCGDIYASQNEFLTECSSRVKNSEVGPNSYTASNGQIKVIIHRSSLQLKPHEKLDFRIAFTAYREDCSDRHYFNCGRCMSIWDDFVRDGVQNCPCSNCPDEDGCHDIEGPTNNGNKFSSGTGTKVTVGAVATILILLLVFGVFLCICRKTQRLCWYSYASGNSVRMAMNRPQASDRSSDEPVTSNTSAAVTPTAPLEPDIKDVPPSYESLFPAK